MFRRYVPSRWSESEQPESGARRRWSLGLGWATLSGIEGASVRLDDGGHKAASSTETHTMMHRAIMCISPSEHYYPYDQTGPHQTTPTPRHLAWTLDRISTPVTTTHPSMECTHRSRWRSCDPEPRRGKARYSDSRVWTVMRGEYFYDSKYSTCS